MDRQTSPTIESDFQELSCRAVPSTFSADDPALRAFPLPFTYRWSTLAETLIAWQARAVMLRVPPFWQLEPLAHAACHAIPAPIHFNDPANTQAARAAIEAVPLDTIVTEATNAGDIIEDLVQNKSRIPTNWILIHDIHAASWDTPTVLKKHAKNISTEIHLVPGVPIAYRASEKAAFRFTKDFQRTGNAVSNTDPTWPIRILECPIPESLRQI